MDQQNPNKINRLSCMNNTELRSKLRILKIRQSLNLQSTDTDGVMNRFGFKHVVNREMSKENKQPVAEESKMKAQKKKSLFKRPSFKVGIPHHKYWSPTARDTPMSHFHGSNRGCRSRKTHSRKINQTAITKTNDQVQPVACTNMNDLIQKETTPEVVKEVNSIDESDKKDEDTMENNIPNVDSLNSDDSNSPISLFDIVIFIILYYWILSFIK